MSTHYFNRIPTKNNWYVFDGYYQKLPLTVAKVREIYNTGHRNIYISMGIKQATNQLEYQKPISNYNLENIQFNCVLIDSLNPPDISIKKILPSKHYLMGKAPKIVSKHIYSWKECEFVIPLKSILLNTFSYEYKSFIECKFNVCRTYYDSQLTNKLDDATIKAKKYGKYM
jgi:hypothetical protein